jgi:hypothetical protein
MGKTLVELFNEIPVHEWKVGDLFFDKRWPQKIRRVHRIHGTEIFHIGNQYGPNPPRGIIQSCHKDEAKLNWIHVERNYAKKVDTSMEVATHTGQRIKSRGACEKCGAPTNWCVKIMGRVGAFWCGCD